MLPYVSINKTNQIITIAVVVVVVVFVVIVAAIVGVVITFIIVYTLTRATLQYFCYLSLTNF